MDASTIIMAACLMPMTDTILLESNSLKVGQLFIVGNDEIPDHIICEMLSSIPAKR